MRQVCVIWKDSKCPQLCKAEKFPSNNWIFMGEVHRAVLLAVLLCVFHPVVDHSFSSEASDENERSSTGYLGCASYDSCVRLGVCTTISGTI